MGNIGGILGLCLGASIISMVEIVWFGLNTGAKAAKGMGPKKLKQDGKTCSRTNWADMTLESSQ